MQAMRARSFFSLLLFVFFFFSTTLSFAIPLRGNSKGKKSQAEQAYQQGLAALTAGKLDRAEKAFAECLTHEPKHLYALLAIADVAHKKGEATQEATYLQKAMTLAPQNAEVFTAWGRYSTTQQKFPEAEAAFRKAIALNPKAIAPRIDLGDLYRLSLHQPQKAIGVYEEITALAPNNVVAHYALALAFIDIRENEKALTELQTARRLSPRSPLIFQALGRLHASRREYSEALEAFSLALKAKPTFTQALLDRGDVFAVQDQNERALVEYTAALQQNPQLAVAHVKIGMVQQKQHKTVEAEKAYLAAIDLDPRQAVAYNNLASLFTERKERLDDALTWAKKASELMPHFLPFQDTLGWVYRARGELDKASITLEKATAGESPPGEILYHLGVVYSEQGKVQEAVIVLKKAISGGQANAPWIEDARQRVSQLNP
jgi:tetratricopeptide (TPR) repeat protein